MASALSLTAWIVSLMWGFSIARIASRSLTSSRPMRSSVVDMDELLVGPAIVRRVRDRRTGLGEVREVAVHEPVGRADVGEVEALVGFEPVREDDARDPLRGDPGLVLVEEGPEG